MTLIWKVLGIIILVASENGIHSQASILERHPVESKFSVKEFTSKYSNDLIARQRRQINEPPISTSSNVPTSFIVPLVPDVNECDKNGVVCAANAECINKWPGYHCQCLPNYIGNGKHCILHSDASFVRSLGKISGWVGTSRVNNAQVSMLLSGGRSFLSINPLEGEAGATLAFMPEILGLMSWLFSRTKSANDFKGFDVTGPFVSCKTTVTFQTGEMMFVNQLVIGQNSNGDFQLDTKVHGQGPSIRNEAKITFFNHKEEFSHQRFGHVVSNADLQFKANDTLYKYKVDRMIQFEEYTGQVIPDKMVLLYSSKRAVFNNQQKLLQYQYSTIMESTSDVTPPCTTREKLTCPRHSECLVFKSSPLGFICMCKYGQKKSSKSCLEEMALETPDGRALTLLTWMKTMNTPSGSFGMRSTQPPPIDIPTPVYYGKTAKKVSSSSIQKTPYPTRQASSWRTATQSSHEIDNVITEPIKSFIVDPPVPSTEQLKTRLPVGNNGGIAEAREEEEDFDDAMKRGVKCNGMLCNDNAECRNVNNEQHCVCNSGYFGNGTKCHRNTPCICHEKASCYRNGQGGATCFCKTGYQGDGVYCQDIDECSLKDYDACGKNMQCFNSPGSYRCKCKVGYQSRGSACVDIKECSSKPPRCGKNSNCIEYEGYFECKCQQGFVKTANRKDCIAVCPKCLNGGLCVGSNECKCQSGYFGKNCQWVGSNFLVFTQGRNLKRLSLPYVKMGYGNIAKSHYDGILVGVDYDCRNQRAYFTDITNGEINTANMDGSEQKQVVSDLVYPEGITVDWLGENIFWTDSGLDRIEVSKLDGRYRSVIIDEGLLNPRAIVCDPLEGLIFWTDWVRGKAKIEVAQMNGKNRRILVNSELLLPNGLTIDHGNRELCWTDAGRSTISCIEYNGQRRKTVYNEAHYPFSLSVQDNIVYWTDWKSGMIERVNKKTGKMLTALSSGLGSDGRLYDIKSVKPCPARESLCSVENGGCDELCVHISRSGRVTVPGLESLIS